MSLGKVVVLYFILFLSPLLISTFGCSHSGWRGALMDGGGVIRSGAMGTGKRKDILDKGKN